jgi:hypothetical protein
MVQNPKMEIVIIMKGGIARRRLHLELMSVCCIKSRHSVFPAIKRIVIKINRAV